MRSPAAVVAAFACLLVACASALAADINVQITGTDAKWTAQACASASAICQVWTHEDGTQLRIEASDPTKGKVAGWSNGERVVYEKSKSGGLGTSITRIKVGTAAAPLGITCSMVDPIKAKGVATHWKVTDPSVLPFKNAKGQIVDGYVTGCQP